MSEHRVGRQPSLVHPGTYHLRHLEAIGIEVFRDCGCAPGDVLLVEYVQSLDYHGRTWTQGLIAS